MCTSYIRKFFLLVALILLRSGFVFAQLPETVVPPVTYNGQQAEVQADTADIDDGRLRGSTMMLESRVEYSGEDTIFHDIRNRRVYIYGQGELQYEDMHLVADYIVIDFNNNELHATGLPDSLGVIRGKPVFTEGLQSFQAEELRYNFETRRGRTIGVITEEAEGFIHGDVVKIQPTREIHVADGKYTTCDDPDPHFHIEFRRAKIIPDDKIVSSVAFLVIQGVPTPLFIPFGFFPNKRGQASGVLIPSYGESRERGFYLENGGFYWGISDHMDLSIRGDIFSRGSWALRAGSNYAVRYRYTGSVNLNYAINVFGERNLPAYERSRDFRVVWSHNQAPEAHPSRTFRASVNAGSRQSSRYNPVSDQDYLSNTFSSNISYSRSWAGRYNFSANLRHSQNTNNRMVTLTLPDIAFSVGRFHPFRGSQTSGQMRWYEDISMNYNMSARNELNIADSLLFTSESLARFRHGISHSVPLSYSTRVLNHFNFSANVNYNERWYFTTIRKDWDQELGRELIDTVPGFASARDFSFSTGLSTRLYGIMQFASGPVSAVRHVITPNVGFSMRPDFADPFWGYFREYQRPVQDPHNPDQVNMETVQYSIFEQGLYGGPQAGRSGNLSLGITNNLEMKVRNRRDPTAEDRKIVLIDNFSINTGYDFARDSLNFNDIRLSGRTRLLGNFDITYSSSFSPYALSDDGRRINQFLWNTDDKLLRLNNTTWTLNMNYTFRSSSEPRMAEGSRAGERGPDGSFLHGQVGGTDVFGDDNGQQEDQFRELRPEGGVDYSVPWNLTLSYSFNYGSTYRHQMDAMDRNVVQTLRVNGNIYLTPNWRVGFQTGFDFDNRQLTYTSIDIYRDLHCWEMTFNWIPMGFRQSYNFTIRVKSSVLQDLKLTKRTHHMDRAFQ